MVSGEDIFAPLRAEVLHKVEERRAAAHIYLADFQTRERIAPVTAAKKVAMAEEFVKNSAVGLAGIRVWRATQHYHAWCKREDWSKWNAIGVSDVLTQSDAIPHSTGFRWRDHSWAFALDGNRPSCSGDKDPGTFRVTFDGQLVMELTVAKGYQEFDEWYETDVNALTVGSWAGMLVDMWAGLELAAVRRDAEMAAGLQSDQASRITLA